MCGILGGYSIKHTKHHYKKALKLLSHRGPYNYGEWYSKNISICMTQLPMSNPEKISLPIIKDDFIISYNGEIYDESKINEDIFSEIDVLLKQLTNRILPDGMFVIAVYNKKDNEIWIVRDEFGIKPIYYYYHKEHKIFLFSSEIKPLLELIGKTEINQKVIAQIVGTGFSLTDETAFKNIKILEPGCRISLEIDSFNISIQQLYPRIIKNDELDLNINLNKSIKSCSKSFREIGLLISGGLDSNLLNSYLPNDIFKFHVSVQGNLNDKIKGNKNNVFTVDLAEKDFWPCFKNAISSLGSPCRMSSILMYQKLAELTSEKGIHGVIIGEGADELFWGYPRHEYLYEHSFKAGMKTVLDLYFGNYVKKLAIVSEELKFSVEQSILQIIDKNIDKDLDEQLNFMDRKFSLEPLLRRADHILMSKSIEGRLPFLHGSIPQIAKSFAYNKLYNGVPKYPLNKLAKLRITEYKEQKKKHFRIPFSEWKIVEQQLNDFLNNNLYKLISIGMINIDSKHIECMEFSQKFTVASTIIWYEYYKKYLYE